MKVLRMITTPSPIELLSYFSNIFTENLRSSKLKTLRLLSIHFSSLISLRLPKLLRILPLLINSSKIWLNSLFTHLVESKLVFRETKFWNPLANLRDLRPNLLFQWWIWEMLHSLRVRLKRAKRISLLTLSKVWSKRKTTKLFLQAS